MSYKGTVKGGVVILEPGAKLPEGTEVRVEPAPVRVEQVKDDANAPTLLERLGDVVGSAKGLPPDASECCVPRRSLLERLSSIVGKAEGLPPDAARNIDRDLYGRPGK